MLKGINMPLGRLFGEVDANFNISSWSILSILSALICSAVIYAMYSVAWRLWFHPLSRFPGPRLAAISDLWLVSSYLQGTTPGDLAKVHEKYGDVVRISPDTLSTIDPDMWKSVYGHRPAGQPEFPKHPNTYLGFPEGAIINAGQTDHAHLRKLFAPGFSDKSLRDQEHVLSDYLDLLCQRIREKGQDGSKALNMLDWYNFITFDFIGFLTFGQSFGCLETSALHPWIKLVFAQARFVTYYQTLYRLPALIRFPALWWVMPSSVNEDTTNLHRMHEAKVIHRISNPPSQGRGDFMSRLIASQKSGQLSESQLHANANVLVTAGSETSATALAGLTHFLLRNPDSLRKLRDEVRSVFGGGGGGGGQEKKEKEKEKITLAAVNSKCRYLVACVDEGLRMYAPLPNPLYRIVAEPGMRLRSSSSSSSEEKDSYYIPPGTSIGVAPYAAARSERNWHRGGEFLPERWMRTMGDGGGGGNDEGFAGDKREASQPFSYGPRNCIGQTLAVMEIRMVIARLVWEFDFVEGEGEEEDGEEEGYKGGGDWLDKLTFLVWDKRPLWVRWKPVVRE